MPKAKVKMTPAQRRLGKAELDARRERLTLRRLDQTHRAIVDLSRRVTRRVQAADTSRVIAARALCEGTDYDVYTRGAWSEGNRLIADHAGELAAADRRIAQLETELDSWRLKAGALQLELDELKGAAAAAARA